LKSGTRHLEYAQTGSCSTKATATPATDEILWNNGLPAPRRARTTARRRHSRQRHWSGQRRLRGGGRPNGQLGYRAPPDQQIL